MEFSHESVLLQECIVGLDIKPDGIYVDGTSGGAGHSCAIGEKITSGRLIALDKDPDAIVTIKERLNKYSCATVVQEDFRDIESVMTKLDIGCVDGVLLDIGVSSHQLDTASRGFSYMQNAPLDMRMSQMGFSAYDLINTWSEQEIAKILFEYGEERFARKIAGKIVYRREEAPIQTTSELVEIIKSAVPNVGREKGGHPAKRTFQAIRIAVNGELDCLKEGLAGAFGLLSPGGRLVVITFHSLEDRIVKHFFGDMCKGCTCPSDFPICICNNKPKGKLTSKKPILASEEELERNSRSHSAKLRIIEKL